MHKRLTLLLAALLVFASMVPVMGENPFYDVPTDHWAYESIEYLSEAGLVEGYPDGTFGGSRNFTRYEMAMVFARILARFEQRVDDQVARGVEAHTADLNDKVALALENAAEALRIASEARSMADPDGIAAALDIAIGTLDAIDARGYDAAIDEAVALALEALAAAQAAQNDADNALAIALGTIDALEGRSPQVVSDDKGLAAALAAAEEAKAASDEALDVALGILDALDASEFADAKARAAAAEALADAAAALATANEAKAASDEALNVALGILDALDAQGIADPTDAQARATAAQALAEAKAATQAADNALQIAIGTLDALDANEYDARIDAAHAKAAEALALAKALEEGAIAPPAATLVMDGAARAAVEEIAADVVAKKLAAIEEDAARISRDVKALETNAAAAEALLASEVSRLENEIGRLMKEFNYELGMLGIRVATLESKFTSLDRKVAAQGDEIDAIWDRLNRVRVTGSNETIVSRTRVSGDTPRYLDPRDPDAGRFPTDDGVTNRLTLSLAAKPYDDVDIEGLVDVVADAGLLQGSFGQLAENSRVWFEAQTDKPLRVLRIGNVDAERVAAGFTPYAIDAKTMDKTSNVGIFANVVEDWAEYDLTMASVVQTGQTMYGLSSRLAFDDMDVQLGGYHFSHASGARTALAVAMQGDMDELSYDVQATRDIEKRAWAYDVKVDMPVESVDVNFTANRLDGVWATADRLPFAAEHKVQDPATYDKPADVNNAVFADQSVLKVRADAPVGSFNVFGQMGTYRQKISAPTSRDGFAQYGVYDLDMFGFTTDVTRSHFTNQFDETLFDQRINMTTRLDTVDVAMQLHKQTNDQFDVAVGEDDQSHFMLTAETPITMILPWTGQLTFGTSFTAPVFNPASSGMHSSYKLSLEDYEVADNVAIDIELSGATNRIEKGLWRKNMNWTGQNEAVRAIGAKWAVAEPMTVNVGYKAVDNNVLGHTITKDLGFEYFIDTFFAGDLKLGYDYRLVHHNGAIDGSGRSIIRAAFSKVQGDLRVNADAKYTIGGRSAEKGNEYDTVASVDMSYPVFSGATFTAGGKYVKSDGGKIDPDSGLPRAEYSGLNVSAGLKFNF